MEREKKALLKEFKNQKDLFAEVLKMDYSKMSKSSESSKGYRKDGNALFLQKGHSAETHRKIFNYYCQSVINAPNGSEELAFAYGNRSAFLLHIKKYEDCIKDCNRALKIATNSDTFKIKILCRKAECLKRLGLSDFQVVLKEAENCRNKIEDNSKSNKAMIEIINKVKSLSISKINHIKSQKIDNTDQLDENLDGIKIKCDQKYGRHLIAAKDYKPGDIILVENLFATTVSDEICHTNCHYCLKICWSGIPCKHCSTAIFCSEDCRHKAWKLFHDIDCNLDAPFTIINERATKVFELVVRAVVIGIREAGSIAQLKADLKYIDENSTDGYSKGFIKDGEYAKNRLESIYVLNSADMDDDCFQTFAFKVSNTLINIAKRSQLFTNINLKNVNEFIKNKDAIFVGSLILKVLTIKILDGWAFDPRKSTCNKGSCNNFNQCGSHLCCITGPSFSPISSLVNHHCFANAARCYTEARKIIIYAIQPIKKNTQIFNSYCCEYDDTSFEDRNLVLEKFGFTCDCRACTESWPAVMLMPEGFAEKHGYGINSNPLGKRIFFDCRIILKAISSQMCINFNNKDIETLSKAIVQANQLKQPSELMSCLTETLQRVFFHVYGPKLYPQSFGQCC